ncbi:DUF4280 domain-containing protein [Francisella tularensis subsp. novicida]|uniref:DUF4280 domain-containing protein n=2 Tax=Francisella tularensis TaxID=263 RepID=A0A6I4RUB1_FRATU|nr:DUF4280 domain-containing protein [Francisella tularensis]ABK88965.1 hypothetical protein FTN_0054 [Francisella tularensis subsp. novicida U112]AJI61877.1 hypothetical protein AW25_146 [Francisella tularensis subsp. novicida U112]EDX19358.1 hypothetical protein FTE_0346 [Francisella tularensis subsp. novicida FTE]MBK2036021.1 DUF4280 domain-containing protein [Francisella tularensis subsp. novicida]MBK2115947.1 DUF4280 domain-containing protein [Francisella tularensis subsp. novicida]
MSNFVVSNALIRCSFGATPSTLTTLPKGCFVKGQGQLAATVNDHIPMVNIKPFGMCNSPSNPTGMGKPIVPTPCPCIPIITSPWTPPATKTKVNGQPALLKSATCMCVWGGQVSITMPGEMIITAK